MLRKHQAQLQQIASDIRTGRSKATNILAHVTPGGGKSAFGMIVAKELAEPLGYKICWVVPRDALKIQGERNFVDQKHLFGNKSLIRATENQTDPTRGHGGCIATYQQIARNPELWEHEFRRNPYILILDECHHVPDKGEGSDEDAANFSALSPLVRLAKIRIFASGTLQRHDGHKIAFIPYEQATGPGEIPSKSPSDDWAVIRYSRRDALEDSAIVPLHFQVMDGRAEWFDDKGNIRTVDSIASAGIKDQSGILRTVLETKYAHDLMDRCIQSWQDHRQTAYSKAKMLVIAPTQDIARKYLKYLHDRGFDALLAISDEEQAQINISTFKRDKHCLVTVGMAYEGLDVPEITHVALLTNIRSRPWIEQAICRANRTDARGGKTHGYIFIPDDESMRRIMKSIEDEQTPVVSQIQMRREMHNPGGERIGTTIAPIDSILTAERGVGLEDGTTTGYQETEAIKEAMRQTNIKGISTTQFKQALVVLGLAVTPNGTAPEPDYSEDTIQATPSQLEDALRKSIYRQINRIGRGDGERIRRINQYTRQMFGDRGTAPIPILQQILRYVNEYADDLAKL